MIRREDFDMTTGTRKLNFTKTALGDLPTPLQGTRTCYYDTQTRGLHVVVTDTGRRTFYLRRKLNGKSERVLIGQFPDFTIEEARGKAGALNSAFAKGDNPADLRRAARAELTLRQLFEEYVERHAKPRTKTWPEMEANFRRYLNPWESRKLSTISRSDVQKLHADLGSSKGHATANRVLELLRAIFNWGSSLELCANANPTAGTRKFRIKARDRFLQSDELPRLFLALAEEPNQTIRDYVVISLITGARKSNVLSMRWHEISFERATWTIPETKNGDAHTVPLVRVALEILKMREEQRSKGSDYVFPGSGRTGHLASPKTGWRRILERAGIRDLRIHDLRRSLGSWETITGASLVVIGKTLGHKDSSSTAIYARLSQDVERRAMETAVNTMLAKAGVLPEAEIIALPQPNRKTA